MELYIIRHTTVDVNFGICYGQTDVEVSQTFEEEKNTIKELIKDIPFDVVFSSPLTRCRKLANSLISNREIMFDDRLKELDFGDWELKNWDDIYNSPKGKIWLNNYQVLPTLNGESYPEMQERIKTFYNELKKKSFEKVLIFAHAGVIRIFKSLIEEVPVTELFSTFKPDYGSVNKFKV